MTGDVDQGHKIILAPLLNIGFEPPEPAVGAMRVDEGTLTPLRLRRALRPKGQTGEDRGGQHLL
jgi:hypothetical protein